MFRGYCTLPTAAALLGAAMACAGCAGNAEYLTEDRLENGLVVILPGIEGHSALNENIRRGLVSGGVHRGIPIRTWGRPVPLVGPLINQVDFVGNRLAGERMAKSIVEYQDKYPDRPVYVVGHSAGGGIAVFTAEAMPEDRQIDGLILLSASISSGYDLKKALSRCRNGIVNFYNKGDAGVLGVGTVVLGTVDGTHGVSAGLVGFDDFDKPGYENLYQVKMKNVSDDSHTTSTQASFVSAFVAPWVLSDSWPAMSGDAYLDEVPPTEGADSSLASTTGTNATSDASAANVLTGRPFKTPAAKPDKTAAAPKETEPAKPATPLKIAPPTTMDEALLAKARNKRPTPQATISPRLPTDEVIGPDADDPAMPSYDPETQADPATIGP